MRFFFFVVISACLWSARADAGAQTPLTGENPDDQKTKTDTSNLPPKVPLECVNTYVPVSERDLYELSKNNTGKDATATSATADATKEATKDATKDTTKEDIDVSKLSDKQTMALCETATESGAGLCELKTCQVPQATVCTQCTEMDKDSTDSVAAKGATPVDKVTCDSGYALKTPSNKQPGNMCMTKEKTYTCAGECQGAMACQECFTDDSGGKTKTDDTAKTDTIEKTDKSADKPANP